MSTNIVKQIPHVATEYELEAAKRGELKAIIVPLTGGWVKGAGVPTRGIECGFKIGDRLYLQEEWGKGDWGTAFEDDIYFTKSTTPEAEIIGWQPVNTMPPEAAQYWYEVESVRVCRLVDLNYGEDRKASLHTSEVDALKYRTSQMKWNAAYPDYPWDLKRWVVVLGVKPVAKSIGGDVLPKQKDGFSIIDQIQLALDGAGYRLRGEEKTFELAKDNGIVIVFGASDDLMELRGAIDDEAGVYDGGTVRIDEEGIIPDFEDIDRDEEDVLEDYFKRKYGGQEIEAIWCPSDAPDTSWAYKTDIPHKTFNVMEDDDVYCVGIIFKIEDLGDRTKELTP